MKFMIVVLSLNIVSTFALAQNPSGKLGDPANFPTNGQGQFFTVKIVPGDKQTKFFVMGKKAAQLNFSKVHLEASYFLNGTETKITFTKSSDHFAAEAADLKKANELQLKVQAEGEAVDSFKMKLEKP